MADGERRRFDADEAGRKALLGWIGDGVRVVHEPTGRYHRAVEQAMARAGLALVKVNPRHARRLIEATGQMAKTDRIDAKMPARMGAALDLPARPARGDLLGDLKQLLAARDALVKDRTAAKNRGKGLTLPLLRRRNATRLRQISQQLDAIEAERRRGSPATRRWRAASPFSPASPVSARRPPSPC